MLDLIDLRVQHGQLVYLLEHRLPKVAKRNTTKRNYLQCLASLKLRERENIAYIVVTHLTSRITGCVTVIAPSGTKYVAHHTDAIGT